MLYLKRLKVSKVTRLESLRPKEVDVRDDDCCDMADTLVHNEVFKY